MRSGSNGSKAFKDNVKHVMLVRPSAVASLASGQQLVDYGYVPHLLPLQEIVALPFDFAKLEAGQFEVVIATSVRAFDFLPASLLNILADSAFFIVGHKTAIAARQYGINHQQIRGIYADIDEMLRYINFDNYKHSKILYLAGKRRRPELEQAMRRYVCNYQIAELYNSRENKALLKAIKNQEIDLRYIHAAIVTSLYSAQLLRHVADYLPRRVKYFCFSRRIANYMAEGGFNEVYTANEPNISAVLQLLREFLS